MLRRSTTPVLLAAALLATSCATDSPTGPGTPPAAPTIAAISPAVGSTLGGTAVTITGSNFNAGSTVSIGGAPATSVVVQSSSAITAVAPAGSAGPAEVAVSFGGATARLSGAFTYVVPSGGANAPPTVGVIAAQGTRPNQPAGMADLGETLAMSVSVSDPETPSSAMTYLWVATAGTFSGTGRTVTWTAPATDPAPPLTVTVTLTVIETYVEFVNGQPVTREHRVDRSRFVRVHDSPNEVRTMARQFLLDFSNSSIPPATVVQNFSDTCGGKADELADVEKNRCNYTITSFDVGDGTPVIAFGGTCVLQDRVRPADACIVIPVRWVSTAKSTAPSCPVYEGVPPGTQTVAQGLDQVTAVYESGRWRLCHSDFVSPNPLARRFKK